MKRARTTNGLPRSTPPGPADAVEPDFFQRLQQLTPQDWETGHKIYGYRLWPIIDRKDEAHFLFKTSEAIDEDYILRHFGSGKYSLRLNDRRGETLASKIVAIHNPDFPPRVSPDEVVHADPRNETYFKVWGPKQTTPSAAVQPPTAPPSETVAVHELSKLVSKFLDRENAPAVDATQAAPIVALVRELKTLMPQQPADGSLAVVDRVLAIADRLRPPAPPPAPVANPLADVQGLVGLARDLKEIFVSDTPVEKTAIRSRLDVWQEFTVAMAPHLSPIFSPLTAMFAQVLGQKMLSGSQQPQAFAVSPLSPVNPPQPTGKQPPPSGQQSDGPVMMMPFLQWVAAPMVSYARMMAPPPNEEPVDPETAGADFASWVNEGFGANPNYDQALVAVRAMGPIGIMAAFRTTPLWTDKGPQGVMPSLAELESKLPAFFNAFLNWTPETATDFEEDDDEPVPIKTFSESGTP